MVRKAAAAQQQSKIDSNGHGEHIRIENVGPIKELHLPVLHDGGVVVVRGENDVGKSHTLKCVSYLAGEKCKLTVRDHQRKGIIEGLGLMISVGATVRQIGELEVDSIEADFDLGTLVNADGIQDPIAADSKRIKALLAISGVEADATRFYPLVGGEEEFRAIADPKTIAKTDVVEMAAAFKRDLERAARKEEDEANNQAGSAQSLLDAVKDIDFDAPHDSDELQAAFGEAVERSTSLKKAAEFAERGRKAGEEARRKLEEASIDYHGPTIEEATTAVNAARNLAEQRSERVAELRKQLDDAIAAERVAKSALQAAEAELSSAQSHESSIAAWKQAIDAAKGISPPTAEEIDTAEAEVADARRSIEYGVKVREAIGKRGKAKLHSENSKRHQQRAETLRESARSVDQVLSDAVPSDLLRVDGGRLVLTTSRGDSTPFAELSDGKRWRIAIELKARRLREIATHDGAAVIVIPQSAWGELSESSKAFVAQVCRDLRVTAYTAEATAGELRSEVFEADQVAA